MSSRPNFPKAGGFVLSYRWLALGVAFFWTSRLARRFRLILSLVGVMCCFWMSRLTVVSAYHIVGSRQMLILDFPFGGGFVLSFPRFALK